ncbi:hypothetical protein D3C86_1420320 [compost metagenome]
MVELGRSGPINRAKKSGVIPLQQDHAKELLDMNRIAQAIEKIVKILVSNGDKPVSIIIATGLVVMGAIYLLR